MTASSWTRQWQYDESRPALADYPARVDSSGQGDGNQEKTLDKSLEQSLQQIGEYHRRLWANRQKSLLLIVHGQDASGKDSLIRTLARDMDPAGFRAWSFGRPQGAEARHDFLWRVTPCLPAFGEIAAFNRSHHEAVIAERVWPVQHPEHYNWPTRYAAIRAFEQHLVAEGTVIIKCWIRLSPQEQTDRLLKRLDKPRKQWKFDRADIDAWEKRDQYLRCAEEAIAATHLPEAPWLIIPGDQKSTARAIVARIMAEQLAQMAPAYPSLDEPLLQRYRQLLINGKSDDKEK